MCHGLPSQRQILQKKPSVFPKDYDFEFPFTPSFPKVIQVCNDLI